MMAKVTVKTAGRPKGAPVEVVGLGLFKNGETAEVDDARWNRFKKAHPDVEGDELTIDTTNVREQAKQREEERLDNMDKSELIQTAEHSGADFNPRDNKDDIRQAIVTATEEDE
jgi:hypothetical protein